MAEKTTKKVADQDDAVLITDIDPDPTSPFQSDEPRDGTTAAQGPVPTLDPEAAAALRARRKYEKEQGAIRAEERKEPGSA